MPDLAAFPREDWAWAMREACRTVAVADLDYGDPRGDPRLREVLAGYAGRVRAAVTDRDHVWSARGSPRARRSCCARWPARAYGADRARGPRLRRPGAERVVPGGAADRRARCSTCRSTTHGVDVDALAATGAQVVVVTPAHQSPTGVVLAAERRHALVAWARATDGFVVEDDYDSEFRYDREPVGVLQGLAPDRVFTLGTVSKSLAPAIRLGWVLAPPAFAAALAEEKQLADRGTPGLDQLALAAPDRSPAASTATCAGCGPATPGAAPRWSTRSPGTPPRVRLTGLAAGFHAVAHLPDGVDEHARRRARRPGARSASTA